MTPHHPETVDYIFAMLYYIISCTFFFFSYQKEEGKEKNGTKHDWNQTVRALSSISMY